MDQAISIMGMPGIAKMVEFNPVRAARFWNIWDVLWYCVSRSADTLGRTFTAAAPDRGPRT